MKEQLLNKKGDVIPYRLLERRAPPKTLKIVYGVKPVLEAAH